MLTIKGGGHWPGKVSDWKETRWREDTDTALVELGKRLGCLNESLLFPNPREYIVC